jgi:hypothetical protein
MHQYNREKNEGFMFDTSKIKIFKLADLSERTLKVKTFSDSIDHSQMTIAFDLKTGEHFVLEFKQIPQCVESN